ncbi:DUF2231 domain-containing protein [Azospirillum thermophilum]|uniref:DUF2231 domain-containing protein n=1 Tax=Azospirillum thermophilum TaxID=2202148 RepID=A0A2S2CYH8_9PROT|nr:DUF2231 domain-containing protein [Azospirillum thermophilum]AWK89574.1 hypothetical protein DEW08_26570 [Azospirillum thermophilum]
MAVKDTLRAVRNAGPRTSSDERTGATSAAAIGRHPIHPVLIPYPVAFLTATLGTDVAYWRTGDPFWARTSQWMLRLGLASGVVAATAGAADYLSIPRARKHAVGPLHAIGNATVLALSLANLLARRDDPEDAVVPRGLALSAATTALLGVTAWAGGEMIYRHRIGVIEEEGAGEPDALPSGDAAGRGLLRHDARRETQHESA